MQIHILSFEGPDRYAWAGGIASRVGGLARALAGSGFETHLWFVGDPTLPGHEKRDGLHLHRWCQWISAYHSGGVYDGEEGKRADYASSLPPFLLREMLLPFFRSNEEGAVILAEEWHTVDAVLHLDALLRRGGVRHRIPIFWNANNTFGFHRIAWDRLRSAATITTVSRYMRYLMWGHGVDPLVIPNGLPPESLIEPDSEDVRTFRKLVGARTILGKIARWDPDKRWLLAVDTVSELRRRGKRPLLIARGGLEAHRSEVFARAAAAGLSVVERHSPQAGVAGLLEVVVGLDHVDILSLLSPLDEAARRLLYRGADAILANSGHEPFGLVGLETMAAGGLACTGGTGEDYAVPGWNALVLQSTDPLEFASQFERLLANPREMRAVRRNGRLTAREHTWEAIIRRSLLPRLPIRSDSSRRKTASRKTRRPEGVVSLGPERGATLELAVPR